MLPPTQNPVDCRRMARDPKVRPIRPPRRCRGIPIGDGNYTGCAFGDGRSAIHGAPVIALPAKTSVRRRRITFDRSFAASPYDRTHDNSNTVATSTMTSTTATRLIFHRARRTTGAGAEVFQPTSREVDLAVYLNILGGLKALSAGEPSFGPAVAGGFCEGEGKLLRISFIQS